MSKYKSDKLESLLKNTKDDTLKMVLFNLKLVPTFSLVIDATFEPLNQYLRGEFPTLDDDAILSLIVAATCQFIFKSYDRIKQGRELKKYLEERGLETKVQQTKDKLTKLLKIGADVLKDMGYTTATMSGILGFASILHPFMTGINELMGRNTDFNIDNIFNYIVLGVTFKGAIFLEQFINRFVKQYEKDPLQHTVSKKPKEVEEPSNDEEEENIEESYLNKNELKSIIETILK